MSSPILSIVIGLLLMSSLAVGQDTSLPPLSVKGMTPGAQRLYLDGVVDGFQIINAKLQREGQKPLYCIPDKVVLFGRDLLVFSSKDLIGPQDDMTIAVSGLLGLMERYPCSKSPNTQVTSEPTSQPFPENEKED